MFEYSKDLKSNMDVLTTLEEHNELKCIYNKVIPSEFVQLNKEQSLCVIGKLSCETESIIDDDYDILKNNFDFTDFEISHNEFYLDQTILCADNPDNISFQKIFDYGVAIMRLLGKTLMKSFPLVEFRIYGVVDKIYNSFTIFFQTLHCGESLWLTLDDTNDTTCTLIYNIHKITN